MVDGEDVNGRKLVGPEDPAARRRRNRARSYLSADRKRMSPNAPGRNGPGILTVGEGEEFLRDGGMIAFVIENRRVRFDINQTAAETARLKISSRLLSVARSVEK